MFLTIITITILFFVALGLRKIFPRLCAVCFGVAGTWTMALLLNFTNWVDFAINPIIVALLMGGSAVGFMYFLESKLAEPFLVFKLPYLLTTFSAVFYVFEPRIDIAVLAILAVVWLMFGTLFLLRNKNFPYWFQKIVECCKNW